VYDRKYNDQTFTLEASGGLINSSLVMQDRETDSYWSLMHNEVIEGKLKGLKIRELPVGEKMRWIDWVKKHPTTLVLSVNGREDAPPGYRGYFTSPEGFRGSKAKDERLPTKTPIFAFRYNGQAYAIPHNAVQGGKSFPLSDSLRIFLFRPYGAPLFYSTDAFISSKTLAKSRGKWRIVGTNCQFDEAAESFVDDKGQPCDVEKLNGFDTFWYNWSLNNPEVKLLGVHQNK
jgi:hypothetical protein